MLRASLAAHIAATGKTPSQPQGVPAASSHLPSFEDFDSNHDGVIDRAEFRLATSTSPTPDATP